MSLALPGAQLAEHLKTFAASIQHQLQDAGVHESEKIEPSDPPEMVMQTCR